jgi:transcription elongation GreA/GreB family factor
MTMPNHVFLERYIPDSPESYLLQIETPLIDAKLSQLESAQREVIEEKRRVAEQSGDNWHDGAFNATDNAAKVISDQASTLFRALNGNLVDVPDVESGMISLGSVVRVSQHGAEYQMGIVGLALLFQPTDELEFCSVNSPMARALLKHKVGDTVVVRIGGREQKLEILAVNQMQMPEIVHQQLFGPA